MTNKDISDIFREADASHRQATPDAVWQRVEASLPVAGNEARIRNLHQRNRMRYLTIAASFLVLAVAGWWVLVGSSDMSPSASTADTIQVEGELLLVPNHKPVFSDAIYQGVVIREGKPGDQLRACSPC
jgi:hypothetical protein